MTISIREPRKRSFSTARPDAAVAEPAGTRLKVLHVLDGLGGGGSERLLWDLVRLTDASQFDLRVVSVWPDDGRFEYAERLRRVGAYRGARPQIISARDGQVPAGVMASPGDSRGRHTAASTGSVPLRSRIARRLPGRVRAPLSWIRAQRDFWWGHLSRQWKAFRRVKVEHPGFVPDVIHAHLFDGLLMGLVCQAIWNRPLVYQVSSLTRQMHDAGYWWAPTVLRHCHSRINALFLAAGYEADMQECGVPRDKMRPVTGVLDMDAIQGVRNSRRSHRQRVREEFQIPESAPVLLSVGRLHHSKGHHLALEALPRVLELRPDAHWLLLGAGDERDALVQRISEQGLSARVRLAGFKSDPLPYYSAADVYLRSHILEGENLSSYQAMAMGLPVVGFDTGAPNDLLPRVGHGMRVPLNDIRGFADAIVSLLNGPAPAVAAGERGARFAEQELDIGHTVRQYEDVYRRLHEEWTNQASGRRRRGRPQ